MSGLLIADHFSIDPLTDNISITATVGSSKILVVFMTDIIISYACSALLSNCKNDKWDQENNQYNPPTIKKTIK